MSGDGQSKDVRTPQVWPLARPRTILPAVEAYNALEGKYRVRNTGLASDDDGDRINAIIADIRKRGGGGRIYLPAGSPNGDLGGGYNCNTPINLANLGTPPTTTQTITLIGDGWAEYTGATRILGNTGTFIVDTMGSQYVGLRDLVFVSDPTVQPNASPFGIRQGRTATNNFAQFHSYKRVLVFLQSTPGASARGTVGLYNVGAESFVGEMFWCIADAPMIFADTNVLGLNGPFGGADGGPTSMTDVILTQCLAGAWTQSGYEVFDGMNFELRSCYSNRLSGAARFPVVLNGPGIKRFRVSAQFEEWPSVLAINANASDIDLEVLSVSPTLPLVSIDVFTLDTSRIRVTEVNSAFPGLLAGAGVVRNCDLELAQNQVINAAGIRLDNSRVKQYDQNSTVNVDPTSTIALFGKNMGVGANQGDANFTLTVGSDAEEQVCSSALTANRTVTLSTTRAYKGARFRVTRTGLGGFTLDVGGLKTIPAGTAAFVDVTFDGAGWRLRGYGVL